MSDADCSPIPPHYPSLLRLVPGIAVAVAAFGIFFVNNDFSLGLHLNEQRKVDEILTGQYFFLHPLLLPEITRFLAGLFHTTDPLDIARLGRTLSAFMAALGVFCAYILTEKRIGATFAFLAALAMAATPMLAVHAHYLKEDAALFGFCALAVLCAEALFRRIGFFTVVLTGLFLGLAASTKLVGGFLVPVFLIAALFNEGRRLRIFLALMPAILIGITVLAAVNHPMILDPVNARSDLRLSFAIAMEGKNSLCCVYHPAADYLIDVIWPDLGGPLFFLVCAGFVNAFIRWRRAVPLDWLMLVYAIVYYGMTEISPYRDWPDLSRNPIPLLLPMMYFAGLLLKDAGAWLETLWPQHKTRVETGLYGLFLLAIAFPAYDTVRLVIELPRDTRLGLLRLAPEKNLVAFYEDQTLPFHQPDDDARTVENNDFRQFLNAPQRYLVLSSFIYDKFAFAMQHRGQDVPLVRDSWASFTELFQYPYCEIRPAWRTYAYSNPTLRVFDLDLIRQGRKADSATNGQPCGPNSFVDAP
jgi:hypothetical protein